MDEFLFPKTKIIDNLPPLLESFWDLLRDKFGDDITDGVFITITPSIERIKNLVCNGVLRGLMGVKNRCPNTYQEDNRPFFSFLVSFLFIKKFHIAKIQLKVNKLHL
jgi:hypothetical protein